MCRTYSILAVLLALYISPLAGQNIPHANFSGPLGVQVNTYNGNLFLERTDIIIPNQDLPLSAVFSYNSFRAPANMGLGFGWTYNYALRCVPYPGGAEIQRPDGRRDSFTLVSNQYLPPAGIFDELTVPTPGTFQLRTKYGMVYEFSDSDHYYVTKIENSNDSNLSLTYTDSLLTQIKDGAGRRLNLSWGDGQLLSVFDANFPGGREWTYSYDAAGYLECAMNPLGDCMVYGYDDVGRIVLIADERGEEVRVTYNRAGRVAAVKSCIAEINFSYSESPRRTIITEENDGTDQSVIFTYDEEGKLIQKSGNCCGYEMGYTYDDENNVSNLQDANGNNQTASYDEFGNAVLTQDALGGTRSFSFGPLNRITASTDKLGNTSNFDHDAAGNLMRIEAPLGEIASMEYDDEGNMTSITDGRNQETVMVYTTNNDLARIVYPIGEENYTYDDAGNLGTIIDANGNPTTLEYDALNRPEIIRDARNFETSYGYDAASNVTSEIDAEGNEKTYEYDAHRRLTGVTTETGSASYAYDRVDNLVGITDGNENTTSLAYDSRSRLTAETDAKGNITRYNYNNNGNVTERIDANFQMTTYEYDALDRLVRKQYAGNTENFTYDANSNLVQCSNDQISYRFTYDALNRLTSKTVENTGQTISYEYDLAGNRTKMFDPEGGQTRYTYDANSRLIVLRNPANEFTFFTYDQGGRLTEQRNHNGSYTSYSYNATDHITELTNYRSDGTIINSYSYEYDGNGMRTSMTDQTGTATYTYDGDNRLTAIVYQDDSTEAFTLDPAGNRTERQLGSGTTTYSYDAANRLNNAGTTTYEFDGNGNLTRKTESGAVTQYYYDGENRLIRANLPNGDIVNYRYDPFGNRIDRRVGTEVTRYFLDGDNILYEMDETNQPVARYTSTLGMDTWLTMNRGGATYTYHTDALGSITALTDENENTVATYSYDAFGNITAQTGNVANAFTYTGREWDEAIGLYYYRSRYYDAEVGRFTIEDQINGEIGLPKMQHKYIYAEQDPINFTDPRGEFVDRVVGAVIGFGLSTYASYVKHDGNISCVIKEDGLAILGETIVGAFLPQGSFVKAFKYFGQASRIRKSAPILAQRRAEYEKVRKQVPALRKRYSSHEEMMGKADRLSFKGRTELSRAAIGNSGNIKSVKDSVVGAFSEKSECSKTSGEQVEDPPIPEDPPTDPPTDPPGNPDNCIIIPIIRSMDPNEIIGPTGVGQPQWVKQDEPLAYTILFENDPDFATAAAQRVIVRHTFDDSVAPFSFRLGDFGFADYYFTVPPDVSYYNQRLDLRDSFGIFLDVLAGIDAANNEAFWILESIDPATGLAATLPAEAGFLAVNDTITRAGEGFVNFTVSPRISAQTGDRVEAEATIFFDDNASITTNTHINTLDGDHPISGVSMIDTLSDSYELSWGADDLGSGLRRVTLYVSTDAQGFQPWESFTPSQTSYSFAADPAESYRFFTIATDSVGNVEPLKLAGEPNCMNIEVANLSPAVEGQNNGEVEIAITGNNGALTYSWSHDPDLNAPLATNLPSGTYEVFVSDAQGCEVAAIIVIDLVNSTIQATSDFFVYRLYPVPAHDYLEVEFRAAEPLVLLNITDVTGKTVYQQYIPHQVGSLEKVRLPLDALPAGNYVLRLIGKNGGVSSLFIKQ